MGAKVFIFDHFMEDEDSDTSIEEYGGGITSQLFELSQHKVPHFTSEEIILEAQWIDNELYDEDNDTWQFFKELEKSI